MLKNTVAELILHCLNVQMRNLFLCDEEEDN